MLEKALLNPLVEVLAHLPGMMYAVVVHVHKRFAFGVAHKLVDKSLEG